MLTSNQPTNQPVDHLSLTKFLIYVPQTRIIPCLSQAGLGCGWTAAGPAFLGPYTSLPVPQRTKDSNPFSGPLSSTSPPRVRQYQTRKRSLTQSYLTTKSQLISILTALAQSLSSGWT